MDVWRIDVRRVPADAAALLSPDEAERAASFRFERGRQAFVATRAVLRELLGSYLGVAPADVVFSYGDKGKPEVDGVSFSISHAGDVALATFASSGRVGADVEAMRPGVEMRALARRFFTAAENDALSRLSGDDLVRGFYGCWTCKEAFVKATGEGLSFGLGRVDVAVWPAAPAILAVDGVVDTSWTVSAIDCGDGYAAAVVADSPGAQVVVRDWRASAAA